MSFARFSVFEHLKKLKHSRQFKTDLPVLSSSGIADDLINHCFVPPYKWGTDLDIRQCLKNELTENPKTSITKGGIYVLPPVSLTESLPELGIPPHQAIKDRVAEGLEAVRQHNVNQRVSLLIPVSTHNDSHWQLARIYIKNQAITSALLWDSFGGINKLKRFDDAFKNLKLACQEVAAQEKPVHVALHSEGIQRNAHSCMDFVIREIYLLLKQDNAITQAESTDDLRLAIVKQIANRHKDLKDLGLADTLYVSPGSKRITIKPTFNLQECYSQVSKAERKELKALFKSCPDYLDNFERYYLHALSHETSSPKKATYYAIARLCKRIEIDREVDAIEESIANDDVKMDEKPTRRMTP